MPLALSLTRVLKPQAGWYQGDFHAHTTFSDGYYDPPDLVALARAEGLDFLAITDHNTIDAYPHFPEAGDLLVIPGIEVTFKAGHFNVFGLTEPAGWLAGIAQARLSEPYDTMTKLMGQTTAAGLLNSINHPRLPPWAWLDQATSLGYVHCLEIWNDPSWPDNRQANPAAVAMWTAWLQAGYRITAIGGSDYHRPVPKPGEAKPSERLGLPRTYVYAEALSGAAILAGVRQRRVYLSMGPQVTFQAQAGATTYEIGADLAAYAGPLTLQATVSGWPTPGPARLVERGQTIAEAALRPEGTILSATTQVDPGQAGWYRFEVWDEAGQMLAITNPIFSGPVVGPLKDRYGDFIP
jgi:hypothetical protein